jgi:hypothetical protein
MWQNVQRAVAITIIMKHEWERCAFGNHQAVYMRAVQWSVGLDTPCICVGPTQRPCIATNGPTPVGTNEVMSLTRNERSCIGRLACPSL